MACEKTHTKPQQKTAAPCNKGRRHLRQQALISIRAAVKKNDKGGGVRAWPGSDLRMDAMLYLLSGNTISVYWFDSRGGVQYDYCVNNYVVVVFFKIMFALVWCYVKANSIKILWVSSFWSNRWDAQPQIAPPPNGISSLIAQHGKLLLLRSAPLFKILQNVGESLLGLKIRFRLRCHLQWYDKEKRMPLPDGNL